MNFFITKLFSEPFIFFTVIISVGFSVCIHEFFHAYIAKICGDNTAADAGHLTLNPFKQMGIISIIMLLLLGFCWGAVPVNHAVLNKRQRIAVALAGPAANLGLFFLGMIFLLITAKLELSIVANFMLIFTQLNLVLFCINILPVPGFDGGTVLASLLPMQKLYASELGKGIMIGMVLLLFYSVNYIFIWSNITTLFVFDHCWRFIS